MGVYEITQGVCVCQDRLGYAEVSPRLSGFKQRISVLIHDMCLLWLEAHCYYSSTQAA